jgi:hypothetical protein
VLQVASISQLTVSRLSRQCGIHNISQPYRPTRPVTGIVLLYFFYGGCDGHGDNSGGGYVHVVFSSFQLYLVSMRRQQQAPTAVQKGHQEVFISPDRRGAGASILDTLHVHVERIYVHTELT